MQRFLFLFAAAMTVTAAGQDCTQSVPVGVIEQRTAALIAPVALDALQARMGSTPLRITSLDRVRGRRIMILVDASGSMGEMTDIPSYQGPALRTIKQTLRDLMEELPSGASVEYGLFSTKSAFSEAFISDPKELEKNIEAVTARFGKTGFGHTALFDALHKALMRFGTPQPGDSILLLTDGGDNSSQLTAGKLEHEFHAANTRLLTLLVLQRGREFELEAVDQVLDLVTKTGGSSLSIYTTDDSWLGKKGLGENVQVLRRFWNDKILFGYVAQVQVPGSFKDDKKWTLSLNRETDPRLKNATPVYPDHLSACPVARAAAH